MSVDWNAILVAAIPSAILAVLGYLFGKRKSDKEVISSIVEDTEKIRDVSSALLKDSEDYWKKRFEDHQESCRKEKEKLREDLAAALVENADFKTKIAELNGYIQGITDPIIKLEEKQKAELRSGRRAGDAKA